MMIVAILGNHSGNNNNDNKNDNDNQILYYYYYYYLEPLIFSPSHFVVLVRCPI
jgi:hypothetical protein